MPVDLRHFEDDGSIRHICLIKPPSLQNRCASPRSFQSPFQNMALAKRSVELFYDVLSPYSWVAFEVNSSVSIGLLLVLVFCLERSATIFLHSYFRLQPFVGTVGGGVL